MKLIIKNIIPVFILLLSQTVFAANAQFLAFQFSGKQAPDYPAIYGVYGDPIYGVDDSLTDDPGLMIGTRIRYVRYLSPSLQFYAGSELGYTGSYLSSLGIEESESQKYYMLDSNSDLLMRLFFTNNILLFGGIRYNYLISNGEYKAQTQIESRDSREAVPETLNVEKYEFKQQALGYTGGFHYVPTIFKDLHMMITVMYHYFPETNSDMEFKLYGDTNDTNKSEFNLHNPEINLGFRLFTQAKKMFEFEVGCRFAYYMYTNLYENKDKEMIYEQQKINYFEFSPYMELIFPIY